MAEKEVLGWKGQYFKSKWRKQTLEKLGIKRFFQSQNSSRTNIWGVNSDIPFAWWSEDCVLSGCKMGQCPKYPATTHGISVGTCMNIYALVEKLKPEHPPCQRNREWIQADKHISLHCKEYFM